MCTDLLCLLCAAEDPCATDNGGCQHDCINYGGRARCECRAGYILATDGTNCEGTYPIYCRTCNLLLDVIVFDNTLALVGVMPNELQCVYFTTLEAALYADVSML